MREGGSAVLCVSYSLAYLALPVNNAQDLTPLVVDSMIKLVNEYDDALCGISLTGNLFGIPNYI